MFKFFKRFNPIKIMKLLTSPQRLRTVFFRYYLLTSEVRREKWIKKYTLKYPVAKDLAEDFQSSHLLKEKFSSLEREGIAYFKQYLSEVKIEKIKEKIAPLFCTDPYLSTQPSFTYETANRNKVHVGSYKREDLVSIPEIMDIANDKNLLALAQEYLRCKPTITNINVWWSFAGRAAPVEAQNYHRDKDDVKFLKFFVYLTNVDELSGPHVYVKKSKNHANFRGPKETRYTDSEVEQTFSQDDIVYITGNAGDAFIEDTFGIHKGYLPKQNDRLVLQVEYSYEPLLAETYAPRKIAYPHQYDAFINRLLIK